MSDGPLVTSLVTRAANGDQQAWNALVERYSPLIWSICLRYQLGGAADDVGRTVWLQLIDHLGELREPGALAGWLATTIGQECARARRAAHRPEAAGQMLDAESIPDAQTPTAEQELLTAELHAALRGAFTRLPRCCQQLLALLADDQPLSYDQISVQLDIPAGSIGPSRERCLGKLRRDPAISALLRAAAVTAETEPYTQTPIRPRGLLLSRSGIRCTTAKPGCTRTGGRTAILWQSVLSLPGTPGVHGRMRVSRSAALPPRTCRTWACGSPRSCSSPARSAN
jgi:RNA polymerase sigma factor (sigma-70 family)